MNYSFIHLGYMFAIINVTMTEEQATPTSSDNTAANIDALKVKAKKAIAIFQDIDFLEIDKVRLL